MRNKKFRDRLGLFGRYEQVEIAHDLFSAPITSGDVHLERLVMPCQVILEPLRVMCDLPELKIAGMPGSFLDRVANFRLRRFAATRQVLPPTHPPAAFAV